MHLETLLPQLLQRAKRLCNDSVPDSSHAEEMLERTRREYSRFDPVLKAFDFTLGVDDDAVTVLDDDEPAEIVATRGVYIKDYAASHPLGQGSGAAPVGLSSYTSQHDWYAFEGSTPPAGGVREMPSILFTEARYRDAYHREVEYLRNEHHYTIVRPRTLSSAVEGVIVYGAVRRWDELPQHAERLILDRALAEYLDDVLVGSAGLVRIPTPHGSFEFDGGRTLLALRDRLIERFEGQLNVRMNHLSQG